MATAKLINNQGCDMIERVAWAVAPPARVACGSVVDVSVKLADDMGRTIHPTSDVRVGLVFRECPLASERIRQDADREASGEGDRVHDGMAVITGVSPFDDPLLSLDDGWDGDDDDESTRNGDAEKDDDKGVVKVTMTAPSSAGVFWLEAAALPPEGCDPPPWGHHGGPMCDGWRYCMGTPTVIMPAIAVVSVQAADAPRAAVVDGHVTEDDVPIDADLRSSLQATPDETDESYHHPAETLRLVAMDPHPPIIIYEDARGTGHGCKATHGTVWDCGLILAGYLATPHGADAVQKAIAASPPDAIGVDVGCGAGTVGLALARAIPTINVVLTDLRDGLDIATRNIQANADLASRCTVRELWWGENQEPEATLGRPVAVVVASDVVYSDETALPLASTLAALCGPQTLCLLGFRNRTTSQTVRAFFDRLTALGLHSTSVPRDHLGPAYRAGDAHLFKLTRCV